MNDYLLSGCFAYDTIEYIDKVLTTDELKQELKILKQLNKLENKRFGGTGGNIAYNASLLGDAPMLIASIGELDSMDYLRWLRKNSLNTETLTIVKNELTANVWIVIDKEKKEVASFDIGAMKIKPNVPHRTPQLWHLAPDNPRVTAELAMMAVTNGKDYFFDPGQGLKYFLSDSFSKEYSFYNLINNAKGIFLNESEWELLKQVLGINNPFEILGKNQFLVKTLGENGARFYFDKKEIKIDGVKAFNEIDSIGCGDALRAGFIHEYLLGKSFDKCLELGVKMGSLAVESLGGQSHKLKNR